MSPNLTVSELTSPFKSPVPNYTFNAYPKCYALELGLYCVCYLQPSFLHLTESIQKFAEPVSNIT